MPRRSHSSRFDHPDYIWWLVQSSYTHTHTNYGKASLQQGAHIFQKPTSHFKILGDRRVIRRKCHTGDKKH
jgi:hypothetical protein